MSKLYECPGNVTNFEIATAPVGLFFFTLVVEYFYQFCNNTKVTHILAL